MDTVVITALDQEGRGIARIDGKAVFVEGALIGERVAIEVYRKKPNYEQARMVELIEPSPQRVTPRCPHFGVCGGCSMQHLDPSAQVAAKQRVARGRAVAHRQSRSATVARADPRAGLGLPPARSPVGPARRQKRRRAGRFPREEVELTLRT